MNLLYAYLGFVGVTGAMIAFAAIMKRRWDRQHRVGHGGGRAAE